MMRPWKRTSLLLMLAAGLAAAADPNLVNLVMPDARMVSGMNLQRAKTSRLGQFIMSQMQSADAGLQKFISEAGFDPRYDLHEVLIASTANPKANRALVMVRGSFDTAKILALAQKHGASVQNYKGVTLLTGSPKSKPLPMQMSKQQGPPCFAFLDSTIALLGDAVSVRGAIDRRAGGAPLDAKLAARAQELSSLYDFWGFSTVPASEWASKVPNEKVSGMMKGDVLQGVLETSGGVRLGSEIEIVGEAVTRSEKDATALVDVIRFFAGLIQLNQKDAKITAPAALLQSLNLRAEGNVMRVSLRIPEADVEKFIQSAKAQMAKQAQTGTRQPVRRRPSRPPAGAGGLTIHSSEMGTVEIKPQK